MKLIYIRQHFKHPSVSRGSRSYETARQLAAEGHDVHIIASNPEYRSQTQEHVENLTIHWVPVRYSQLMSYKERIKAFLMFAFHASKTARSLRGDVVFASSTPLTVAIPGMLATIFRKRPLVFEVRDLWPDAPVVMGALDNKLAQKLAYTLEKITYKYSSHIVALSPDMKDGIVDKGVESAKVTVIPNASDNQFFDNHEEAGLRFRNDHKWLGSRKLVLYCGTLGRVNDVSYVARLAAATARLDESVRFLVVGGGSDEERVRNTAHSLGVLQNNFFMMDRVPKAQVPAFFAAADLSISTVAPIPLLAANSANKVFDSFASGTPIAINHEGWLADLIREKHTGTVLNSDADQAARQLIRFLYATKEIRAAAENAKLQATESFDRQKLAAQLAEVLLNAHRDTISKH